MPYLRIDTNVELDKPAADDLCAALSAAAAQWLGKPEQYVLACVRPGLSLTHGGTAEPAAYAECKSIGLPKERTAITHKFEVGGHEGYVTVGIYEDGTPGEIFIRMNKEGSTISGLMDGFATTISMARARLNMIDEEAT